MKTKHIYEFGSYQLDAAEKILMRGGQAVPLPPKDLETLIVLVDRAGHLVTKDELLQKVWPGVFIEEGNLARHIFNLRQVLGEAPDGRKYIETVPKRGYRFIGVLEEHDLGQPEAPADVPAGQDPTAIRGSGRRTLWRWLLALVLAAAAVLLLGRLGMRNSPRQKVMLAVLPFVNLSGDAHEDYFADGLTEEMIAQLGQLQPAKLGVIARTSIVRYKNTKEDIAQIGQELGVGYLLEGSVRRADGRVRITAQLIQAAPQTHVWAETYERPLTDVLSIQREIAESVTHSLSIELLPNVARSATAPPVNLESYDKYLLGRHELELGTRESVGKAIEYFQEAIAEDPNDARYYSALAKAYGAATTYYRSPFEVMPKAKEAALRAVQLDSNFASAHVDLGYAHLFFDWDWPAADREFRRALEINPSLPEAQLGYADYLGTLGRSDEALSRVQQAYLYDPLNVESRNEALWIYYFSGRMPETIDQSRKVIELEPAAGTPYSVLAMAYAQMGNRTETIRAADQVIRIGNSASDLATVASALAQVGEKAQADKILSKALELAKHQYVCRFIVATAYTELGGNEKALESLEQAFLQRST